MDAGRRCLSLARGRHHYVFWYSEGQESLLLAELVRLAATRDADFDWLDAAVLSHQMGKGIGNTAEDRLAVSP